MSIRSAALTIRLRQRVVAGHVTLDFTGVAELGDEFLEELFLVWAPAHPRVTLQVVHLPSKFAAQFFSFAKRALALSPTLSPAGRGRQAQGQR